MQQRALLLLGAAALLATVVRSDILVLKDGSKRGGNVSAGPKEVCLQTTEGQLEFYKWEEVLEIVKGVEGDPKLQPPNKDAKPDDTNKTPPPKEEPKPAVLPQLNLMPKENASPADIEKSPIVLIIRIVSAVGSLACMVGWIMVLVNAFQDSVGQGLLCLCISCYAFYYLLARYDGELKKLVLILFFGGILLQLAAVGLVVYVGLEAAQFMPMP
ncbi:MAG: hypothetical protein JXR37_36440 [Kiritimatiellae bacterium]|nr:hypothetical protein [Kiritimatiellia bacterium]